MNIINTANDLQTAGYSEERQVFLTNLLNDYLTFDDAVYPKRYDRTLEPDEDGYVAPIIRTEWNAASAAAWGFEDQGAIETMLAEPPPPVPIVEEPTFEGFPMPEGDV